MIELDSNASDLLDAPWSTLAGIPSVVVEYDEVDMVEMVDMVGMVDMVVTNQMRRPTRSSANQTKRQTRKGSRFLPSNSHSTMIGCCWHSMEMSTYYRQWLVRRESERQSRGEWE